MKLFYQKNEKQEGGEGKGKIGEREEGEVLNYKNKKETFIQINI